jgi:hypothetical protein
MKRLLAVIFLLLGFGGVGLYVGRHHLSPPPTAAPLQRQGSAMGQSTASAPSLVAATGSASAAPAVLSTPVTQQRQQRDQQLLSPEHDGWQTEAFAEAALAQLKQLASAAGADNSPRAAVVQKLTAEYFHGHPLRPEPLDEVFHDAIATIRRPRATGVSSTYAGPAGLNQALELLVACLPNRREITSHVKVVSVQPGTSWTTTALVELVSHDDRRSCQVNATWVCQWQPPSQPTDPPRLRAIQVTDYQEAEIQRHNGPWFADATRAVLGDNAVTRDQLAFGHHYWLQRIERVQRFDTSVRNGLAVGDANGDGLDDLYVCQPPGLPNRLFVQQADGTASDHSAVAGVDFLDQTSAALFCDLDNDGDQDLVLATPAGILILQNDSRGSFALKAELPADYDVHSLSAADYDRDGRLDLFACVYRTALPNSTQSFLYRDAVGGGLNQLYRNEIQGATWKFADVTAETGLNDGADRFSLAASWEDYDNDGDPDLYIANDFGPNYLYENRDGRFVNVADRAGAVDIGSGMSVSWGDYNRDGFMDLYVGNMFSSAGKRVTSQPTFRPAEEPSIREIYQRLAKGNSLFANRGDGTFQECGAEAGVELGRWAWSSVFVDLNNDGWEDLLVANGYITTEDTGDL